jgi:hypothetical protein
MTGVAALTPLTGPTPNVDLSDDALADELAVRRFLYDTDELVAQDSVEASVTARNLDVGVADAGQHNPDQTFSLPARHWGIINKM